MMRRRTAGSVITDAFLRYQEQYIAECEAMSVPTVMYSSELEEKMNGIIAEHSRRKSFTLGRRVMVIVTVTLLLVALSVTVYANYDKIKRYIFNYHDNHVSVTYPDEYEGMEMDGKPIGGEQPQSPAEPPEPSEAPNEAPMPEKKPLSEIEVYYTVGDIPEGYEQKMKTLGLTMSMQLWKNAAYDAETGMDTKIVLTQSITHNLETFITNSGTLTEKHIAGHDGYWVQSSTYQIFGWRKGDYAYKIQCSVLFTEEQLYDLVNSVEPIEAEN